MKPHYSLYSQVGLAEDLLEHHLKRGDVATIVEHYPMPGEAEDSYSLEGFDLPQITVEVVASQILPIGEWRQQQAILTKLRRLSQARLLQLEAYLDALLQNEQAD